MYLLLMGPMLEEKYGSDVLLKVVFFTALVTGFIHCIFWGSVLLCGASGVVFAFIVLSSFTAFKEGEIPLCFVLVAILFIGKEVYSGIAVIDNVSQFDPHPWWRGGQRFRLFLESKKVTFAAEGVVSRQLLLFSVLNFPAMPRFFC